MDRRRSPGPSRTGPTFRGGPCQAPGAGRPTTYRIQVEGHLDDRWADWPTGLAVERAASGDTFLTVPVRDQAELLGLLRRLRDAGARLVSVNPAGATGQRSGWKEDRR